MSIERTHKKCKDCGKRKPTSQFYKSSRSNGNEYYASYCKPCSGLRSRETDLRMRIQNYPRLWEYYAMNPCVDCGEDNPLKLSADHTGDDKHRDIADMMAGKWHRIVTELKKCVIRCHNCHAVKTAASMGYFATESLRDYVTQWEENAKAYEEYAR